MKKPFPFYQQLDAMDCGPTCLRMIAQHYGRHFTLETLRKKGHTTREGVSLYGISRAAEEIGFHTMGVKTDLETLREEGQLPAIVHWNQEHFVVVYKFAKGKVYVAGPGHGKVILSEEDFLKGWASDLQDGERMGIALLLETTPDFFSVEEEKTNRQGFGYYIGYLRNYRSFMWQVFLGLLVGMILQLILPFLTQSVVDYGIGTRNIGFIYLMMLAQVMLFVGQVSIEFLRSWLLLHISTRFNIAFISDFLIKLMKLPLGFFDSKMTGDLIQRIRDHQRVENFLTNSGLSSLFSFVNILVVSCILAYYNLTMFLFFLLGTALYIGWTFIFLKKRRDLDYKNFARLSADQSKIIELIKGIQEIKLNNLERQQRWTWERIQASLYRIRMKSLALAQYQSAGSTFFQQITQIIITAYAAVQVINGEITLGMMLAITYLLGQLNGPVAQLIVFIRDWQDAQISLERLHEIHMKEEEETPEDGLLELLPESRNLKLENVSFHYAGPDSPRVLHQINLDIPEGKTTAIVGTSGSGKTTLIKLLLKFYPPTKGQVYVSQTPLSFIQNAQWRQKCGVVMQDGFMFHATIAYNIALEEEIDKKKLLRAVQIANIQAHIESLPLGYNTKIGEEGVGLSAGQKQRLLIARAVYKDPEYLFFDEATNALDASNERTIMENMEAFFHGKTVVVVAHRLSTVRHADQIVVLEKGEIVERGTHQELVDLQGAYFELVSNQLELGQ
ncbi:MAG: peptidase domain-containing ABC transporter [Bacteroidota bacterium]